MGNYLKALDDKGRIKLPPIFRETLAVEESTIILTRNLDGSINLYPKDEFRKMADHINGLSKINHDTRTLVRLLVAESFECSIDAQNRINVPTNLLRAAGLNDSRQVIMAGMGNYIQIWHPDRYEKSLDDLENIDLTSIGADLNIQL